jgi:histo-blood group ABO system transferase
MKIGLLIIATNKYTDFLYPLIESANKYFLNNHDVTYFVFTNQDLDTIKMTLKNVRSSDIVVTKVEHKEWPWMTLGRYGIFHNNKDIFNRMDYLYYCDADMLFVGEVGDEILSDRVGTTHPGYHNKEMKEIESNKNSSAYIRKGELKTYFAGGFNGGLKDEYLKMANILSSNIIEDHRKGIIARWHDESHMNRYFINNPPSKVLDPGYCYPEGISLSFEKRLLALKKDHKSMQI